MAEIEPDRLAARPGPGVWAIGKDAEHVIDATGYHVIVRRTLGQPVSSRRPVLERRRLTSELSPREAVERLRRCSTEGAALIAGLTDAQLDLPTQPPRARDQRLAETIERVMIGHYETHRAEIVAKDRNQSRPEGAPQHDRVAGPRPRGSGSVVDGQNRRRSGRSARSRAGAPMNPPITLSSTYVQDASIEYGRDGNAGWRALETALGALDGGRAVTFASGLAAATAIAALVPPGGTVVLSSVTYFGVRNIFDRMQAAAA